MIEYPEEFEDYKKIMDIGAKKYGENNWLEPNGNKSSFRDMHDSMFHHLAESFTAGPHTFGLEERSDIDSKLDPILHLICRCQMVYTRLKRGIEHKDDGELS